MLKLQLPGLFKTQIPESLENSTSGMSGNTYPWMYKKLTPRMVTNITRTYNISQDVEQFTSQVAEGYSVQDIENMKSALLKIATPTRISRV